MDYFVARPLSENQKQIIRELVPLLEREGAQIANEFYKVMMRDHPQTSSFFNKTNQKLMRQPKIMAYLLLRYAQCIDDLSPLELFIEQIVNKHVGLQINPYHYTYFGIGLMQAFVEILGDDVSPGFLNAWKVAYANLAQLLIDKEELRNQQLPYRGFREFKVVNIVQECPLIKLIYIEPANPMYLIVIPLPGQYVCTRWDIPGEKEQVTREYSVTAVPNSNMYRITIKHLPKGLVLGYVHSQLTLGDSILVAPPNGQFHFTSQLGQHSKHWVFVIGGIGITPTIPIMEMALERGQTVTLLWSNKNPEARPFVELLTEWKAKYPNFTVVEYFTRNKGKTFGAIDTAWPRRISQMDLDGLDDDAHLVHLVGPRGFMNEVKLIFDRIGFTNIKALFYGPTLFLFLENASSFS